MSIALVTGGSRGLGHALVAELLARDYHVHVLDVRPYPAVSSNGRAGDAGDDARVTHHSVDLARFEAAPLVAELPTFDLVICNAGITAVGDFAVQPLAGDREVFEVNVLGHLALLKELLAADKLRAGGHLAFTNSAAVSVPWPVGIAYASSKSALDGLGLALESYLVPQRISVTRIYPGAMRTEHGGYAASQGVQVGADPERVAARVLRAILRRRRRVYPDRMGLLLTAACRVFPRTMARVIRGKLEI